MHDRTVELDGASGFHASMTLVEAMALAQCLREALAAVDDGAIHISVAREPDNTTRIYR